MNEPVEGLTRSDSNIDRSGPIPIASDWDGIRQLMHEAHPDSCLDEQAGGFCLLPHGHEGDHQHSRLMA